MKRSDAPAISVCIPCYNAALHLRECLNSVLAQTFTDFELLVADDGSTDASRDIVRAYADPRVRLIEREHDYIATLNALLDAARGRYVARMDADDLMPPDRLRLQFDYMEAHPGVGVLGGAMEVFGEESRVTNPLPVVSIQDMINTCCLVHPTVMMRRTVLERFRFRYEAAYIYAEDYRLWMRMLMANVRVRNLPDVLVRYRKSPAQVSRVHSRQQAEATERIRREALDWLVRTEAEVSAESVEVPMTGKRLTVVIPFLNEGDEVGHTVRSVRRTAGDRVDIIVINDCSDDDYDYLSDLEGQDVVYVYNRFRIGAAASKEKGARLATTPYFLLLDAHMRFYDSEWPERITAVLDADDRQLLCAQSKPLIKENGQVTSPNSPYTSGAYLTFSHADYMPGIRWNTLRKVHGDDGNRIPCVLGAGYAASKRYWNHIRGLQGLIHYGCEEAYVSLKTWLEGGSCRLLPEVVIGHIYRTKFPYRVAKPQSVYNYFVISETLFPTSLRCMAQAVAYRKGTVIYDMARYWILHRRKELQVLREEYARWRTRDFTEVMRINDVLTPTKTVVAADEVRRLPVMARYLANQPVADDSLFQGRAGRMVALCEYGAYAHTEEYDDLTADWLERISQDLVESDLPVGMAQGVCGMGWALLYLLGRGLVDDDLEAELQAVDRRVQAVAPGRVADFGFERGLGGILCYVTARLGQWRRTGRAGSPFSEDFLSELREAARRVLASETDYRSRAYALLLLAYGGSDWEVLPPMWEDIVDLPVFLPKDEREWRPTLDATTGYFVHVIKTLNNELCDAVGTSPAQSNN